MLGKKMAARHLKLAAIIPLVMFGTTGCVDLFECQNEVLSRNSGPHGKDAVVFVRDCGATTTWTFHVSIVDPGIKPDEGGNVFSLDAPDKFGREFASRLATWAGNDLLITYPAGHTIYLRKNNVTGVSVRYEVSRLP